MCRVFVDEAAIRFSFRQTLSVTPAPTTDLQTARRTPSVTPLVSRIAEFVFKGSLSLLLAICKSLKVILVLMVRSDCIFLNDQYGEAFHSTHC